MRIVVNGDCMNKKGIYSGDILFVRQLNGIDIEKKREIRG